MIGLLRSVRWIEAAAVAAILTVAGGSPPALAEEWEWRARPTEMSALGLERLRAEIVSAARLEGARGVDVQDLRWQSEDFEVHLVRGTLWKEREIEGRAFGAFFTGEARVGFRPSDPKARTELRLAFGEPAFEEATVRDVYLFLPGGLGALDPVEGGERPASAAPVPESYGRLKAAFAQLGMEPLEALLNRDGRSKGAAMVVFAPESIRIQNSRTALAAFIVNPAREKEVRLAVAGHAEIEAERPGKFWFWTVASAHSTRHPFRAAGRVSSYGVALRLSKGFDDAEETATIRFRANAGVRALLLDLTSRLRVSEVIEQSGRRLPFLQWRWSRGEPNAEDRVLVDLERELSDGEDVEIRVNASGPLFERIIRRFWLADEDLWHPRLDDPEPTLFEVELRVAPNLSGVAPGVLVEDRVDGSERVQRFRTRTPRTSATCYMGDLSPMPGKADDTRVEIWVESWSRLAEKNQEFVRAEIENMVRVFNRLFLPVRSDVLRVVSTPTSHGRGFEGLILLSSGGGFSGSSSSDVFRAHEVAHQWWGNLVETRDWPEDRWISESFAEYAAMEYYRIRFESPRKTRERIYVEWAQSILQSPTADFRTLRGKDSKERPSDRYPLVLGRSNVYTKGPLVLHSLRYLFYVRKGNDEAFWAMLRDFLESYRGRRAGTREFRAVAEKHLGADLGGFFEQWVYGARIPTVRWHHRVEKNQGRWRLVVEATSEGTDTEILLPVRVHFTKDRILARPLAIRDGRGTLQLGLPEEPLDVTLNDEYESLVRLERM